ncbi:hypothetical protein BG005_009668 [Podila minutissima]|nr:hypothetical protein BG005_009668 [Podila minutissima]
MTQAGSQYYGTRQQQQHTPRYRHVSAPVQQPQNLSSFQEGMRQDSPLGHGAQAMWESQSMTIFMNISQHRDTRDTRDMAKLKVKDKAMA